jgi:polysaccharide export outer membrane protein
MMLRSAICVFACCLVQQALVVTQAHGQVPKSASENPGLTEITRTGMTGGMDKSPALTGERRPLYRLRPSDVLAISFTFAPEFDQTVTVQPDGFITLKGSPALFAERTTLPEIQEAVRAAYAGIMHDPDVSITLKDFTRPCFIAAGQVARPGKYELRSDTTLTEGVALAGGFNDQAKHSQVVLFRRVSDELVESQVLNIKHMLQTRSLKEDVHLRPGDVIFVPQNTISKLRRYLPVSNLSLYTTPTQF